MNPFDLAISSLVNGFAHRSLRFDEFVIYVSISHLFKGVVVLGIIWGLWFQDSGDRRKREALLAATIASVPALAVARVLSWLFFRPRPFNEAQLSFRIPFGVQAATWQGYSSFPSDHAVLFFALATGILIASRRAGWFTMVYVTTVICLPRVFIGEHYATDIVAGAAIGISLAYLANCAWIRGPLTNWALQWLDEKPGQFYGFSFFLTYIMATLFNPVLDLLKAASLIIHRQPLF